MIVKTVKYKKPQPKAEKAKEVRAPALYKSLHDQIINCHYKNALKTTSKLLRLDEGNEELLKTRIFLLLQLDLFNQALDLVQDSKFSYEHAYSNYRLKNEESAVGAVETSSSTDRKWSVLKAQLLYRQGDYQGAMNVYESLMSDLTQDSDEYADLETNFNASRECLEFHRYGYMKAMDDLQVPPLDVLENNPAPFPDNYKAPAVDIKSVTVSENKPTKMQKQKEKRRAAMHSKNANKNMQIDPERWIPMKERSYYRKPRQQMSMNHKRR